MDAIANRLSGGHPNSLGNTIAVVNDVLANTELLPELFNCYSSVDEVVRLRTSNAIKRICKENSGLIAPYLNRLITEVSTINQASAQWTLADLFGLLVAHMSPEQHQAALGIMKHNLAHHKDWIVLNQTMNVLCTWAAKDASLKKWLRPHLKRLSGDSRKSVSKKAVKSLTALDA